MKKLSDAFRILRTHSIFELASTCIGTIACNYFLGGNVRYAKSVPIIVGSRNITWGRNIALGRDFRCEALGAGCVIFGSGVTINDRVHIGAIEKIEFGDDVLIGSNVLIIDHQHGVYSSAHSSDPTEPPAKRILSGRAVKIGDRVWLGDSVSVLPGTSIGAGSIVGTGSVVSRSIPENVIAVGSPAQPIKFYCTKERVWKPFQ